MIVYMIVETIVVYSYGFGTASVGKPLGALVRTRFDVFVMKFDAFAVMLTIVDKSAGNCQQLCRQLWANLLTIVSRLQNVLHKKA